MENQQFIQPLSTVDLAIFSIQEDRLQILLVKRKEEKEEQFPNQWALAGGIIDVNVDETVEDCAMRKLKAKTGVESPYLEQLGFWGGKGRDARGPGGWAMTHAYFALVPFTAVRPEAGTNASEAKWEPVVNGGVATRLAFDHNMIVEAAVARLRGKVEYTSLPAFLLPKEFTVSELQRVYEIVLGRKLDKSAFRTRVLSTDMVVEVPRVKGGANRPAQLYKLRNQKLPHFFHHNFKPV